MPRRQGGLIGAEMPRVLFVLFVFSAALAPWRVWHWLRTGA
jgi:hypothetical protein